MPSDLFDQRYCNTCGYLVTAHSTNGDHPTYEPEKRVGICIICGDGGKDVPLHGNICYSCLANSPSLAYDIPLLTEAYNQIQLGYLIAGITSLGELLPLPDGQTWGVSNNGEIGIFGSTAKQ